MLGAPFVVTKSPPPTTRTHKQITEHALSNCNTMLDQDRCTWRHISVLRIIMETLKDVSDLSWSFYCVLPVGENTIIILTSAHLPQAGSVI